MTAPRSSDFPGKVYLVGGGPGDPGLISVKGRACLEQADFILYDGLVNPLLLRHTHATAERAGRVDDAGQRTLHQEQINERLIAEARLGKTVVRLKGGDPFIFGRGSEEAAALAAAGIEFEVVPGITAATAAAEYAGFSLTHRDHASAVCLVTGHEDSLKAETALDYRALAQFPGTLVFYMGLHRLSLIADSLIAAGLAAETPAAVITKASTPFQRVITAPLSQLAAAVEQAGLRPPSLIIVGHCVGLRERINWFERKPLFGKQIAITRPVDQAEPQIQALLDLGAAPVLLPLIEITAVPDPSAIRETLSRIEEYDWVVFTSANGVQHFLEALWHEGLDTRVFSEIRLACIGTGTAAELERWRLRADLIPEQFCSEALAAALIERNATGRILWPRANRGRDVLPTQLRAAGLILDELVVYEHHDVTELRPEVQSSLIDGDLDWICLSSPAIARQLAALLQQLSLPALPATTKIAAISPITAAAAREVGLPVHVTASEFTWDGLFEAIQIHEQKD